MPDGLLLVGFIAAALVVLVIPGPGVLYVLARTLSLGYRAGLASVAGLSAGALVHVIAASAGLSALLLTSATAFTIVKTLGAGYLIYLGLKAIFSAAPPAEAICLPELVSGRRLFWDGVVVSVLNPKIAVFFLAFLPQFIDPALGQAPRQIMILGLIYVALALVTDGAYVLLAGSLRHLLSGRFVNGPVPRYLSGSLYIGLGLSAALAERRS